MNRNIFNTLLLGIFLLTPGCAAFFDSGPPMSNVFLPVRMPEPSIEGRLPVHLLVAHPAADDSARTDRIMALMNGFEVRALDAAKWSSPVPQMVRRELVNSLENTRRFAAVGWEESNLGAKYSLGTDIRWFYLRYEDSAASPVADIAMVFTLTSLESGKILGRKLMHVQENCAANSVRAFVEAFSNGMTGILAEVSQWAAEQLETEAGAHEGNIRAVR